MSVIILTPWDSQGNQITDSNGICHTIRGCGGGGYQQGYILERMKYRMTACYGGGETSQTLDASYYKGPGARNGKEREIVTMEPAYMSDRKGHNGITEDGTATTLNAQEKERPVVGTSIVRRLTPRECERLQGMPDDWSRWGVNEKGEVYELPDSARYRLQGNGIATPFWKVLMRKISALYEYKPTLASLFDGQGSFPMIWEEINGPGTALWSSEIEKHAVAVAKFHFPEEGGQDDV